MNALTPHTRNPFKAALSPLCHVYYYQALLTFGQLPRTAGEMDKKISVVQIVIC